jgi:cytochrome c oxidase subunit 3
MDAPTAYNSAKLGMWLFLATEVLLFGGLFAGFAIYRWMYLEEFHTASLQLNWKMGAINTAVLIFSSFTAAMAVDAAQHGDNARVKKNLGITILCGFGFLIVKYLEYSAKASHGLFPGNMNAVVAFGAFLVAGAALTALAFRAFHYHQFKTFYGYLAAIVVAFILFLVVGPALPAPSPGEVHAGMSWGEEGFLNAYKMYFGLYYCMTGLHALHVILGMGICFWVYLLANDNRFSADYYTPVEVGALYWHLVDLIWIYLFPLLYLID